MNTFLNGLKDTNNFGYTENGAVKHNTTKSAVLDMFSLCGAYRSRSDEDCIVMFKKALIEDESLAMKCLFYLRDCRGGQGERRFFRVCFKWLCDAMPVAAKRNLDNVSNFGRWDDLIYSTFGTSLENDALNVIKEQLALDVNCKTPSLLGKWLPSENASAQETKAAAAVIRNYLGISHKVYRKTLSTLRARINVLERLMSAGEWDKIEFDKIPSKAGLIYKNAFARRDIIAKKYEAFAKDTTKKVNAETLYPYDVAHKAFYCRDKFGSTDRAMIQKYWDNLPDYYGNNVENGLAVVDVSGSMSGSPMEAAVSLGAYIAEKAHGPFANHFITFSSNPQLVEFEGVDIVDKFNRARRADWGRSTNIEATFDMLLGTALRNHTKASDMPTRLYIFSDMEFNAGLSTGPVSYDRWTYNRHYLHSENEVNTLLESIEKKWNAAGYELPQVIFWNLNARHDNIPALGGKFAYVSGLSPVLIQNILSNRGAYELMLDKLNSERYACVK